MPKLTLDGQREALQTKRKNKSNQITDRRKENEYYEARLSNYRQGSQDIQSSIFKLERTLGHEVETKKNIQNPEIKKQVLLDAMHKRKRIIQYQTDDHNFVTNSHAVAAYLKKKEAATSPQTSSAQAPTASQSTSDAATSKTASQSYAATLKTDAERSNAAQLVKMGALIKAVEDMKLDGSNKADEEALQAFVDLEIDQQKKMHSRFENTIYFNGEGDIKKRHKKEEKLHDEYDKILLELRDVNLKKADELCRQHYNTTNNEDWPEVTKTWFFGPDNYREYSKDRDPVNVVQYFSYLASTGMFNGMEFGEASMSPRAKPTLKINSKGELELVEPADERLKQAFNEVYPNSNVKKYFITLASIHEKLFSKEDAKKLDRFAGYKDAATKRLEAKIDRLKIHQDVLTTTATSLQTQLDNIEKFETPQTPSSGGYQRPQSTGPLGKLKDDLDAFKKCKQELDAVKSFPMLSNTDLGKRASAQKKQIEAAEKLLPKATTNSPTPTTNELYQAFNTAYKNKDETKIKAAKTDLEKRCKDTLAELDKKISETEAKIKPLQAQYFEIQRLQRECKKEQHQTKTAQVVAGISYRCQQSNIQVDPSYWSDVLVAGNMAHVIINNESIDMLEYSDENNYNAQFYVDLAQQTGVAPLTIYSRELTIAHPFLIIDAQGKITFPEGTACPQELQTKINELQKPATVAAKTTAAQPPTSAPPPPTTQQTSATPQPTSAQTQATISGTENAQPVADIGPARNNADAFAKNYNTKNSNANLVVSAHDPSNPTSFTVSASSEKALNAALIHMLKACSAENPTATFVAKNPEGNIIYFCTGSIVSTLNQDGDMIPIQAQPTVLPTFSAPTTAAADTTTASPPNLLSTLPPAMLSTQTPSTVSQPALQEREESLFIAHPTQSAFTDKEKATIQGKVSKLNLDYQTFTPPVIVNATIQNDNVTITVSNPTKLQEVVDLIAHDLAFNNPNEKYGVYDQNNALISSHSCPKTRLNDMPATNPVSSAAPDKQEPPSVWISIEGGNVNKEKKYHEIMESITAHEHDITSVYDKTAGVKIECSDPQQLHKFVMNIVTPNTPSIKYQIYDTKMAQYIEPENWSKHMQQIQTQAEMKQRVQSFQAPTTPSASIQEPQSNIHTKPQ